MVFTLPKNASHDYKMVLASFTYSHTWYNMPDVAGQAHMATFMFQPGPTGAEGSDESSAKYPFQGNIFIKSCRILPSDTWDHQTNPSWYKWPWHSNTAFTAPRTMSWWLSRLKDCMGRVTLTGTVPAAGLARQGDGFPGLGQHVPHSPIHAQERPSGQSVCALWPSGRCSCSGQCQELPIACSARGGVLLSGYVLQALVAGPAGLAAHVLDWTQGRALAYDEQSWPKSALWRGCVLGKTTDEAESEYIQIWKRERERERDMVMFITLYASAW